MWKIALSEIMGTFFFISCILMVTSKNAGSSSILAAFIIGLALTVSIYFVGKASLGSLNPAVTLSLLARGDLDATMAGLYIISEIIGGLLAFGWWKMTLGSSLKA